MDLLPLVTFGLALGMGLISGMSGGGGGFVMIPYFIGIGLHPAQALATAKFGALGTSVGAMTAFKGKGLVDKKYLLPFITITFACAVLSAWLIPQIHAELFEQIIGIALLAMIPTLFIHNKHLDPGARSHKWIVAGFIGYTIFSFLQTLVGSGLGTMVMLVLMYLFGMGTMQAMATKRVTQSVQALVLLVLLALQNLVVWSHGIAGALGALIGNHIGTNFALKRGVWFVKVMLAVVMAISGVALLL